MKSRLFEVDFKKTPHELVLNERVKIVGTLCNKIYMGTLAIFRNANSVVFTVKEWEQVKDADIIEYTIKGQDVLYDIAGEIARKKGGLIHTPDGLRWAVRVDYWTPRAVGLFT